MHIYIPGKTRFGKSTLLFWMALQDIARGKGVCVMDAKGDLVLKLLDYIPRSRIKDTIYLDITTPAPLDFMDYSNEREKEAVISEIKYTLMKTVEPQHAPVMTANLTDVLYTLLNYNENPETPLDCRATFLDIYEFLENEDRRTVILSRVTDEGLRRRWKDSFPNPTERSRITTRMTPFIRSETLRKIFGAKNPKLNIAESMDSKKVLLVNLGPVDDIQRIYGTLLLSKIRQAAYRRANPKYPRVPFHFYADEFQEFQTSDFDQMLSMAGGLGLYLTLANQYADQLEPRILSSIKGNVSTFIFFRTAHDTVQSFIHEIPPMKTELVWKRRPDTGLMDWTHRPVPFAPSDLATPPVGRALYRAANGTARYINTPPPPPPRDASSAEAIRKRTIETYACDTPQVCFTGADGNDSPKPDDIGAGPAPNVSPHGSKKKNT
jgi:hypothetical protein